MIAFNDQFMPRDPHHRELYQNRWGAARDAGRHRSDLNLSYTCLNLDIDEGGPDLPEPEQGPGWATGSLRHAYSRPV